MEAIQPGRQVQRLLWAIGEAHRRRRDDGGRRPAATGTDGATTPSRKPGGVGTSGLELHVAVRGGQAHLAVVGVLDGVSALAFLDRVGRLVDDGARSVVVDLGGADVIDLPGAAALGSAWMLLGQRKGELVLKSPRSGTLRALDRAGLGDRFVIC